MFNVNCYSNMSATCNYYVEFNLDLLILMTILITGPTRPPPSGVNMSTSHAGPEQAKQTANICTTQ